MLTNCTNSCDRAMGAHASEWWKNSGPWSYLFLDEAPRWEGISNASTSNIVYVKHPAVNITIKHCLAEPLEGSCRVGLSPILLLTVAICVIVKTIAAIHVTVTLRHYDQTPLVTLGDAIASFIEKPDQTTSGLCSIGHKAIWETVRVNGARVHTYPRKWRLQKNRRAAVVPVSTWVVSYLFFTVSFGICSSFFLEMFSYRGL